jgi:hypothetical protein
MDISAFVDNGFTPGKKILGRKVLGLSCWRTIISNYPRECEEYLPGEFGK